MAGSVTDEFELEELGIVSELKNEPSSILPSLSSYETTPLVSIEEAIRPLVPFVPQVEQMLEKVKSNPTVEKDGLTLSESSSIMIHTVDWQPRSSSFYYLFNKIMREANQETLRPWYLYLKLFTSALAKLPTINGYVYRRCIGDLSGDYCLGKTFVWCSFSLCSRSIERSEMEMYQNHWNGWTEFQIECKSGKDIRHHSLKKNDENVLLLSGRLYRVMSKLDSDVGDHFIHVKEIDRNLSSTILSCDETNSISTSINQRNSSISVSLRDPSLYTVVLRLTGSTSIHHNTHLEDLLTLCKSNSSIDLSFRDLIDQDMSLIVQRALIDKRSIGLYLEGNLFSDRGLTILINDLYQNRTLTELDLSSNQISDDAVRLLAEVLMKNDSIIGKLHLGSNNLNDRSIEYLAKMLETNRSLKNLMLNRNRITNRSVKLLTEVLIIHNRNLESLSLACNKSIDDGSIPYFTLLFEANHSLTAIDLKYCSFSSTQVQHLRDIVKEKSNFQLFIDGPEDKCVIG